MNIRLDEAVGETGRIPSAHHITLVPFKVGTTEIALSTSIGIVLGRGIGTSALTMVADADEAMYGAKQRPDVDYVLRPVGAPRHRR